MVVKRSVIEDETENHGLATKAIELGEWLQEHAARIEDEKRVPEDIASRLIDAGLFRITQPRRFGGLGCSPSQAWEAVFEIARGCGSCAWLVGLNAANVLMLGKFSDQVQKEVFLSGKPTILAMLTGGVGYDISVKRAESGAIVSGRWHYASGIDIASWAGLLVPLPDSDGKKSEPHILLVPKEDFTIDHASWNVLGMKGTGSKDIELKPTFVPEHRWMSWAQLQSGIKHPTCPNEEAVFSYPLNSAFALSVAAPTLGVASAVAEEFCSLVRCRTNGITLKKQADDKVAQIEVAEGNAMMAMLRQALVNDSDYILEIVSSGRQPTPEERAGVRMRIALTSRLALSSAQSMFSAMGGSLLRSGSRAERLFRDLHAMSSHLLLQPEGIGEAYGRLLLGMELPEGARL